MTLEPVNLVQIALAAVAILGFLLTAHSARLRALSALMLMAAVWMVFNYLEETAGFRETHLVTPAFRLVYPPLFFLLARGLIFSGSSLGWRDAPHFLPFALGLLLTQWLWLVESTARVSVVLYALATAWLIFRYQRTIRSTRSDAEVIGLRWMYAALAVYLIDEGFDIARMDLRGLHGFWPWLGGSDAYFASLLSSLVMTIALIYLAIRHRNLFDGLLPGTPLDDGRVAADRDVSDQNGAFQTVDAIVRRDALYTEPRLTLAEVAKAAGLAERDVSAGIRDATKGNFNAYINRLRIEDVCEMMAGRRDAQGARNVLEMAYVAGFSSKSVFNAWFRQETGKTPSQFRAEQGNSGV